MKKLLFIMLIALTLGGCGYFKKISGGKKTVAPVADTTAKVIPAIDSSVFQYIKVEVMPSPLKTVGDTIKVSYSVTFPANKVKPDVRLEIIPIILYVGDTVIGERITLQGEAVKGNSVVVPVSGGSYKGASTFAYSNNDYKGAKFFLMMQTITGGENILGTVDQDVIIDTLFTSYGVSIIDRLLLLNEFMMLAKIDENKFKPASVKIDSITTVIDSLAVEYNNGVVNAVYLNNLGVTAYESGDMKMATEKFNAAAKSDPLLIEPRNNLAIIAIKAGDYLGARKLLGESRDCEILKYINGEYSSLKAGLGLYNRVLLQILSGDLEKAEAGAATLDGGQGDLLKIVIFIRKGELEKVDSLINQSGGDIEKLKHYPIINNEIEIIRKNDNN